jgi:hypothetical protein
MPAGDALALLATHVKLDPTYLPVKDDHSRQAQVGRAAQVTTAHQPQHFA